MKKITLLTLLLFLGQVVKAQDSCASAFPITEEGIYTVLSVNGSEFPTLICAPNGAVTGPNAAGEWYAYTPSADHTVTVTTDITQNNPRIDTRVHVYTGTCGNLICLAGDDDSGSNYSSIVQFNVTANTTYIIAFDNKWRSNGFQFQLIERDVILPIEPPINFTQVDIPTIINANFNTCVVDMNNDYLDDLVGVNENNIRIHYQNANGTFSMMDFPTSTAENDPYWSISAGDYNNDGFNDLMYGGNNGVTFMKSNANGTAYVKDTPGQYIFCQRTNFIDLNNDGNLDAFSCHDIAPNVYYLNDGSGNFSHFQSSVTPNAMAFGTRGGNYASLWFDYDNDGDSDLFISKCSGPPCELHRNNGDGTFTDVSAVAQLNVTPVQSWSSAIADFDNDGDMDIMIGSNGNSPHMLFKNNLDTTNDVEEPFSNITAGSGFDLDNSINRDYIAYDFDNDGFVDIMGGGNKIHFNNGDGTFSLVIYPNGVSLGAVGDFNNDGFLDIQNSSTLHMNGGNDNKWITLRLRGMESNKNGIGARIEIYGAWGKQIRDVRSGEGFQYMSTLNTHFGIGNATTIDKIVVKWPSGTVDTILNPAPNQSLMILEGSTLAIKDFANQTFSVYPNPATDVLNIKMKDQTVSFKSAQIFDLNARLVMDAPILNETISVKNLATGTYILLLKDGKDKHFSQKFLKK